MTDTKNSFLPRGIQEGWSWQQLELQVSRSHCLWYEEPCELWREIWTI